MLRQSEIWSTEEYIQCDSAEEPRQVIGEVFKNQDRDQNNNNDQHDLIDRVIVYLFVFHGAWLKGSFIRILFLLLRFGFLKPFPI